MANTVESIGPVIRVVSQQCEIQVFVNLQNIYVSFINKVIATMVIRLLDDRTYCINSFGALTTAVRLFMTPLQSQKYVIKPNVLNNIVDLQPFGCSCN